MWAKFALPLRSKGLSLSPESNHDVFFLRNTGAGRCRHLFCCALRDANLLPIRDSRDCESAALHSARAMHEKAD